MDGIKNFGSCLLVFLICIFHTACDTQPSAEDRDVELKLSSYFKKSRVVLKKQILGSNSTQTYRISITLPDDISGKSDRSTDVTSAAALLTYGAMGKKLVEEYEQVEVEVVGDTWEYRQKYVVADLTLVDGCIETANKFMDDIRKKDSVSIKNSTDMSFPLDSIMEGLNYGDDRYGPVEKFTISGFEMIGSEKGKRVHFWANLVRRKIDNRLDINVDPNTKKITAISL